MLRPISLGLRLSIANARFRSFPKPIGNPGLGSTRPVIKHSRAPRTTPARRSGKSYPHFRVFAGLLAPDAPTMVCHSPAFGPLFSKGPPKPAGTEGESWQPH